MPEKGVIGIPDIFLTKYPEFWYFTRNSNFDAFKIDITHAYTFITKF